jgi:hypothetical protein
VLAPRPAAGYLFSRADTALVPALPLLSTTHAHHQPFSGPWPPPQLEFGADTVVIVRDEAAKARLPPELRPSQEGAASSGALVLTVADAKGLEFDDVLLVRRGR